MKTHQEVSSRPPPGLPLILLLVQRWQIPLTIVHRPRCIRQQIAPIELRCRILMQRAVRQLARFHITELVLKRRGDVEQHKIDAFEMRLPDGLLDVETVALDRENDTTVVQLCIGIQVFCDGERAGRRIVFRRLNLPNRAGILRKLFGLIRYAQGFRCWLCRRTRRLALCCLRGRAGWRIRALDALDETSAGRSHDKDTNDNPEPEQAALLLRRWRRWLREWLLLWILWIGILWRLIIRWILLHCFLSSM